MGLIWNLKSGIWDLAILFEKHALTSDAAFLSAAKRSQCLAQTQAYLVIDDTDHDDETNQGGFQLHDGFLIRPAAEP